MGFKSYLTCACIIMLYRWLETVIRIVCNLSRVHTIKVMRIESELIRIACVHTECALTAIRIQFAFPQSTSIGGLKPV